MSAIATYLHAVQTEAATPANTVSMQARSERSAEPIPVTRGQLDYEWQHLLAKLRLRDPSMLQQFVDLSEPEAHPLFKCVPGLVAEWEVLRPHS